MDEQLALRPLAVADAEAMAGVLADPALYAFTGGEPPTEDDLRRRYTVQTRGHSADGSEQWLTLLVLLGHDRVPVGYVQATIPVDGGPAEVAWVIGTAWQGRGLATRAARLLLEHLAARGVRSVVAHVHPEHHASNRVAEAIGLAPTDVVVDGETRWAGPCGPVDPS